MDEPVQAATLKALVRAILDEGRLEISSHAMEELGKDELDVMDVHNVLRGGWFQEGEWENGEWRYRARTQRICVVFAFRSDSELVVITGWREAR
jgi:hypothetical protein